MKTLGYWIQNVVVAFLVMAIGYWVMTAFTFSPPAWLVVPAATLGVLLFVDWLSRRALGTEPMDWLRPVGLAVLVLVAYGLLTRFDFLPSSALFLAVLVSTILADLVLDGILARSAKPSLPLPARPPSA